jgi:hypothetical protein
MERRSHLHDATLTSAIAVVQQHLSLHHPVHVLSCRPPLCQQPPIASLIYANEFSEHHLCTQRGSYCRQSPWRC